MIVLSVNSVCFSVGARTVLDGVSFSLNEGDKLGIVGVNGAGKSTLLKIISKRTEPASGEVFIKKDTLVGMLDQNDCVNADRTPYEEMLSVMWDLSSTEKKLEELSERMRKGDPAAEGEYHRLSESFSSKGGYEYKSRIKGMLKSLGIDWQTDKKCSALSGGEKTRLALAGVLLRDPEILILDEPTNHLDTGTLKWLEEYLQTFRKTLLVVSHDRYFLDRLTTHILEIDRGKAKLYSGNYSVYVEKKKRDREIAERHYKNQQREIRRIEEYIAQQRRWNRERNIIAAESRQKMLDKMEKLERPLEEIKSITLAFHAGIKSGEDVLKVRDLSKAYGSARLFEGLSFDVHLGDRLFVIGHNGCGKSTLMKILTQRLLPDTGVCAYGYNVTPAYFDQENQNLDPSNTVLDELWNTDPALPQLKIRSALAQFGFTGDDVGKTVRVLSFGERARLTFSKLILKDANLLFLDEPTNHLDIQTKEVLEDALSNYDGTLVCVSHDRYFVSKLSDHILDFDGPDGKPIFYSGSYEQYLGYKDKLVPSADVSPETVSKSEGKRVYLDAKREMSKRRKNKARLEKAGAECERIEEELARLDEEECLNATDYVALSSLQTKKEELEEKLLALYEEIETLKTEEFSD